MNKVFSLDGPVFAVLSKIADLCLLNILWLISSLPLFTIGASTAAVFTVTIEMVKGNDVRVFKDFFTAYFANLKRGIIIWLILVFSGAVIGYDYYILTNMGDGIMFTIIKYILTVVAVYYGFIAIYIFAILPTYKNTVKNAFRNAMVLPFLNLPYSLVLLGLLLMGIFVSIQNLSFFIRYGLLFWLLLGFALICYLASFVFVRIFIKDFPEWEEVMNKNTDDNRIE